MPTNEERREAAENLRMMVKDWTGEEVGCAFAAIFGVKCGPCCFECQTVALSKAADLIEPEPERTCEIVHDDLLSEQYYGPMARCSHCGAALPEEFIGPYYYCPNCGAKVVE